LPFASALWNALAAGFGWSLAAEEVRHFYLPSPLHENRDRDSPVEASRVILLVEDNPADVNLIREALDEHQVECKLIHIRDGQRALEFIESLDAEQRPSLDLVILDLNLPRKPGSVVLEAIRASARCPLVPVAVLTSSDNQKDKNEAARLGASVYIRKPSRLAEFLKLGGTFKEMIGQTSQ
jgi:chemotaxis family two-component system response regulator Rcp1